jgi:hypothetical protein
LSGSFRGPLADGSLGVTLYNAGMVGIDTVDEYLNLGISNTQLPAKIRADTDNAVDFSGEHEILRPRH